MLDGSVRADFAGSAIWFVPGKRSFSGLWWSSTIADHVGYESWLERDRVMALDFDPDVVGLSSQPFRLSWQENGKCRSHTPNYFVRLRDGTGVVVDTRADDRIESEDAEAFAVTAQACKSVGWEFCRVGAMDAVRTANLRWLAGYRHPRCLHAGREFATAPGQAPSRARVKD